jgi:hypothetical protein
MEGFIGGDISVVIVDYISGGEVRSDMFSMVDEMHVEGKEVMVRCGKRTGVILEVIKYEIKYRES